MAINNIVKETLEKNYDLTDGDLACDMGDTIKKDTNIVLKMKGEQLIIPVTEDGEEAIKVVRKYLLKMLPTGKNMQFSIFQRSMFVLKIMTDPKGQYAIVLFNEKNSGYEAAQYLYWSEDKQAWEHSKPKLQIFEKIRIQHGIDNIGSIDVVVAKHESLTKPRAQYSDNTLEIPMSMRNSQRIRKVEITKQDPYHVEIRVQSISMEYVAKGKQEIQMHNRLWIVTKKDNKPIRIHKEELEVPNEWWESFKGVLDFEVNPLNTGIHSLLTDAEPKYHGDNFYVTHSNQFWVRSQNSWIPVHKDYVEHYVDITDIKAEGDMYRILFEVE